MLTCFVIQPFDAGKFDKRFDDVFVPAIEEAGLEPYRVDRDPSAEIPIEAIESGIRSAAICLADITTNNPNVWFELGFALASRRPVAMVCSNERTPANYPFDIRHRGIIVYKSESPSDFAILKTSLCNRLKALMNKSESLRQIAESDQIAPTHGLTQNEILLLAIVAGDAALPDTSTSFQTLKTESERLGLTSIGFKIAYRRLAAKKFLVVEHQYDWQGEAYSTAKLTDAGWGWIESNETLFILKKNPAEMGTDKIPF